jgi:hypothetical protein|eukprot:SAG25_NODE_400_length_8482_cov_73.962901_7_plen_56_part_00
MGGGGVALSARAVANPHRDPASLGGLAPLEVARALDQGERAVASFLAAVLPEIYP